MGNKNITFCNTNELKKSITFRTEEFLHHPCKKTRVWKMQWSIFAHAPLHRRGLNWWHRVHSHHPRIISLHGSKRIATYFIDYLQVWPVQYIAILAHSQNPQQPVTLAETCLQISLMVTDIQNISRFGWNLQSFRFSITGAVSVPIFGVPLDLWLQDLWSHCRV